MKPHVTLRDIAEKLSVSLMSVSMALHNNPKISAKRRLQVQEEARRMGYNPNAMAVALAHQRYASMDRPIGAELAWLNCWRNPRKLRKRPA